MITEGGGGQGFLGEALVDKLRWHGTWIVAKIVAENRESANLNTASAFDQEVSLMHYLGRHRNVAVMIGWCEQPLAMLMKYYQSGTLKQ